LQLCTDETIKLKTNVIIIALLQSNRTTHWCIYLLKIHFYTQE